MSRNGKQLRFAALVRVSTEKQEKSGESLRTQTTDNKESVDQLGGRIVLWYGGQEHATPGYEKGEVDRLVRDAQANKFDAVIVAHTDRWSRDNSKSRDGLSVFKKHKIKFYVGTQEYDLFNPTHQFYLGVSAEIGQLHAATQNKKSMENRIHRAKRGLPTCGKLPFGRTYDDATGQWQVDKAKRKMIQQVAKRYLAGESMAKLAKEFGVNHSNLHKTLTKRCGDTWEQRYNSTDLNIHETVSIKIPRLLPEDTIQAITKRVASNKTYTHGHTKYKYLLNRMVFCEHCGYAMFGQTNHPGKKSTLKRYYRHAHSTRDRECTCKDRTWVDATVLEDNVIRYLFEKLGNPEGVQRAIEAAVPNKERIAKLRERGEQVVKLIEKTKKGVERLVKALADGTFSDEEVASQLKGLREQESKHQEELDQISGQLENVPSPEKIRDAARKLSDTFGDKPRMSAREWAAREKMNNRYELMTWDDKRALVQSIFGGVTPDGKRMGVYISWPNDGKEPKWRFSIRGQLVAERHVPRSASSLEYIYDRSEKPGKRRATTSSASY